MDYAPRFVGEIIAMRIEQSKGPFKYYLDLSVNLREDEKSDPVIIKKMAEYAKTSKHVRAILQTVYDWNHRSQEYRDYVATAAEELRNSKVPHKVWAETLDYYERTSSCQGTPDDMPYGMPPVFRMVMVEKALATAENPEKRIEFCSSRAAMNLEEVVLSALREIDLSIESWRAIADSVLPESIKKIAWEKIQTKRGSGKNHKIDQT